MRMLVYLTLGVALLWAPSWASGEATPDDAKAMAIKAAAYLHANGPDKALDEFNAADGPWHDRDLYVTVQNSKGVMVAHGSNPGLVGKSVLDLRDVDGKLFNRDIQAVKDSGWVTFKWRNPVTKAVEAKTSYNVRVDDFIVGVGAYAH